MLFSEVIIIVISLAEIVALHFHFLRFKYMKDNSLERVKQVKIRI